MSAAPVLTPSLLSEIFSAPIPYKDPSEESQCSEMIDALSPSEVESAARTSYAYHVASASSDGSIRSLATDEVKRRMAMRMARRHLEQKRLHGTRDAVRDMALESVRECLKFREEWNVDALRFCFRRGGNHREEEEAAAENGDASKNGGDPKAEMSKCASLLIRKEEIPDPKALAEYEGMIRKDESAQPLFVRGRDVKDRAVVVKFPRTSSECDEEAYLLTHIYVAERAAAATEFTSGGREEKLLSVVDFENYGESCRPPFHAIKRLARTLQDNYPERLDHMIIVEPPFWVRALFAMMRPFLDKDTRGKVVLVNGERQRVERVSPLIEKEQAMPFMLPGGELSSEVDVGRYLRDVPFFASYDG